MRYVDEFRGPAATKKLLACIERDTKKLNNPTALMKVCGGHIHAIYRHGLENLLSDSIEPTHGPSCPVCVTPMGCVDDATWLAQQENVILATLDDVMRAPGSETSLMQARVRGVSVYFVYSLLDALRIVTDNLDKQVVFFAVGFETTAPPIAATIEVMCR